ncbi:MAG: ATP-binding protein [Nitrospinota bacterium]
MKPKRPKTGKQNSEETHHPNSSISEKSQAKRIPTPKSTIKPRSALDNIRRKSSSRQLTNIIAERNAALNFLHEMENKYEKLFSVLSDGVVIFDSDSKRIFDANDSACKLFGYERKEIIQLTVPELSGEPKKTLEKIYRIINEELKYIPLRYIKTKSGNKIPTEVNTGKFEIKNKSYMFAIYRDITKQISNQEAIKRKSTELEKSNQALKDFVSIASHDLQAPLRKIISFSSRIKGMEFDFPDQAGEYLDRMHNIAYRMQDLLNDLLTFSQVSAQTDSYQKVDLNSVLKEVLDDFSLPDQTLKERIEISALPQVEAQAAQMRQLFQNLISNSIKFHKEGTLPTIKIYGESLAEGFYKICIEDQGIGFDEKHLERIFQPFERLHGKDSFEGTGMGLAICKKIAEGHCGTITAKSQPNEGACFIITIPEKRAK